MNIERFYNTHWTQMSTLYIYSNNNSYFYIQSTCRLLHMLLHRQLSGHVISQLVFSTSAWPATVYKPPTFPKQQNEESCMTGTGIWTTIYGLSCATTDTRINLCEYMCVCYDFAAAVCVGSPDRPEHRLGHNLLTNSHNISPAFISVCPHIHAALTVTACRF